MAEDFDFNNLGTQPKPKPVLNSQNLYDALKGKNFLGKEEISIGGQTISTPKDLETFLTNDKNQQKFYEAFQSNPKFKSFGIKDASQFKSAMAKPTGPAWMPTPAKPESTIGVPEFDPQEVKSRVDSGFAKIAARGLNVTPSGVELTTPEQFKEFTMIGAEEYEQWKRQNEGKLAQSGINPYAWDRDLTEYVPSSEETFQKQTEEEAQRLLADKNAQAVNTIITELGIKPEAIGEIADEQFKDPNYSYKVKTEAFGFESEADVKIENIFTTLTQLGYGEEEAYDFINNQRDAYRQRKFKQLNYEKNQQAVKTQSKSTQLKGINVYQLDMDQKGFNMLNDKQKAVANEYSKLDELNLQLRRIQNRKGNAFEAQPEVEKLNSEIKATQERIKTLQVEADGAPVTLYDPIQRLPVAPEIAAQSIAKANQKYNESYYQNNLLGNIKQDRDTLLLETEELRETIVAQSKKIEEAANRGIQVSPREQISLSANTKLYNDKVAELYVLNKGIYTNSNPLKRENANFAGGVEQFVKQSTFGGLSRNTQGLMSSEEAQIMASKLTSYGFNVSAKDLEAGKMGAFESFGYSFLPMLGTMAEMAAYQAMGNVASEAVVGTRMVSVAREFLKNTYGTNSLRVKAFDIFLKESLTAATQIGSYVAADQSVAGAVGEIYSERAFEKLTAKKQLEKLAKGGKGRILYVAGKFLSGAGGETLSETAGTIADEFANNGYNLRAAFDLATEEGQLGTVALASLVLTSPGDIGLLLKTQSKFNEYLVKKAGVDVDPAIIEMKREIDAAIDNYNNRPTSTKAPEPIPVMDAMVEAQPVPMGEGPIQAPEEAGASEQEVPQEKVEQVRQEEKLEVEKRVANLGEEFHVVEKDGEVEKQVTYRYNPETGKLQSKGYTDFNNAYSDVNEDLKAQVEQKMKDNGMLSASKALEIAKKNLNIDEDSKLIWKDGKLLYSRDEVNRVIEQGAEGTRNTAKSTFEKVKQKRAKVDEIVFENTEKVNTDDSGFNVMVGAIRRAFGGKLRLDYGSFFFNGAKINTDGQRGIPRLSNYMAPIIESFTKIGNGASRVNAVVANIINSKYFNESFTPEDMVALQQGGLVNDAAMNLLSNLLINEDAVLSEVFDEDPTMIRDFKALREQLNTYASKEFVGSESKNFSYAFYNTRISESRSNLTEAELAKTGKEFGLAQEEKRQIQNIAMSARGEEYTPEEVASIRYSEGKIGAQEFLDIVKEDTTGLTEEEIKTKADAKSKVLNVAQDFETYKSRKESLGKSRKARIAKIKKMALDNVFDFKVFGVNPQTVLGKAIGPIPKGRKLRKQKDYAARIMNTQLEFLAMRAGFDDAQLEEFIDTMLTFEKIDEQAMIQVASNIASSQSGRVAFSREMSNDPSFQSDKGFGRKYLAKFDEDNDVDPVLSYFLRGWYKSATGMWMYEQGHPDKIMTKEGVRPSDGQIMNLKDVIDSDKFFEFFPGLQNLNVKFEIGKGDRNFTEMQGDTLRVVLPSNYSNEMLLATVMSEVRDIAAREVGLPSQPIVKTSQEIFDDFLNAPIYKDSARADKLRNAIESFKTANESSEEGVSASLLETIVDPNAMVTPEAAEFRKELLADPEMRAMLNDFAVKYHQMAFKQRFINDVGFKADPVGKSIDNDYLTISTKLFRVNPSLDPQSEISKLITALQDNDKNFKTDVLGLLDVYLKGSTISDVQKVKIQEFMDRVIYELKTGGNTLTDIGLIELMNDVSDPGFKVLASELSDLEFGSSYLSTSTFSTTGALSLGIEISSELDTGEDAMFNGMQDVSVENRINKIRESQPGEVVNELSRVPERVQAKVEQMRKELAKNMELAQDPNSEDFKKAFGNSKVVDGDGNPMIVYRGVSDTYGLETDRIFYTDKPVKAFSYVSQRRRKQGTSIRNAYVKIENPIVIDGKGANWNELKLNGQDFKTDSLYHAVSRFNEGKLPDQLYGSVINPLYELAKEHAAKTGKNPDGIIFKNIKDYGPGRLNNYILPGVEDVKFSGNVYVPFSNEQVFVKDNTLFSRDLVIRAAINLKEDGSAIIYAVTDPNVSSPIHEMAHLLENYLTDSEKQAVMDFAGESEWNTNTSEAFARGFERFLYEGESPNKQMSLVFEKFKQWLTEIYNALGLANLGKELNPQMTSIYKTIFGEGASQEEVVQQDEDQEIYDLIEAQRANKVNDESIYMGLLRAGYAPQDLTEFFNARTKQTVANALEQQGTSATKDMARAVYMDSVTIRRTSEEIVAMLQEMDPVEREMMRNTLLSDIQNSDITLFDLIATLQEKVARGEDATKEFNDITSIGTHAGRLLQRMATLKENSAQNTLAQLIRQFNSRGRKIPTNVENKLKGLAEEMDEAKKIYEQAKLDAQNFPTELSKKDPSKTNYQYYFDAQNNYKNARFDFFKNLKPYARAESFWDLYDTMVRGNLLTFGSFVINLSSNAVKSVINIPLNFVAGGISMVRSAIFKNTKYKKSLGEVTTSRGLGYYKTIAKSLGKATTEAISAVKNGSVVEDANGLQISRGFNGIRAARDTFGMLMDFILNKDMTQEELAEKYNFPIGAEDNKIPTKDKVLRALEGTFGLVAELNFRALGGPDAFFKTAAYYGALFEQAKIKGFSNVPEEKYGGISELQFFIDMNSDYSNTEAMEEAAKLIYANNGALYKVMTWIASASGKDKPGVVKSAFTTLIPYQKIPTNVAEEFLQFSNPVYSFAASAYYYATGTSLGDKIKNTRIPSIKKKLIQEQREALRNADISMARMLVGAALQSLAYEIALSGALSGSASPSAGVDDKERRWKKEFMPADNINLTLLIENLTSDKKRTVWKKGDDIRSLRDFGVFGAIMSMTKTEIEKENRENFKAINISDINLNVGEKPSAFKNLFGMFPYLLDQTMVKNLGDLSEAVFNFSPDPSTMANFLSSYFNTVVTAFAPNHLNTFTKFGRDFEISYKASPEQIASMGTGELTAELLITKVREKLPWLTDANDYTPQYDITGKPSRQVGNVLDPIGNLFGLTPVRRKPGLDPDSYIFEHQKNIQEKTNNPEKELTWNDIIFQVFTVEGIKDIIPNDVPKTIKVGEGIIASLNAEEQNMFREERNKKRDEVVKYIVSQANGELKKMLDINSDYNKSASGQPILYKDGKRLGLYLASVIMKDTYSSIDGLINQTLAPVIMRKKYDQLTPEEKKYIDQVNKNNVLGELFNQLVNNDDVQEALKKAGKDLDTVFGNLRGQAEQYQPQGFDEGPGIEGEGGIDSGPSIDDGEGI